MIFYIDSDRTSSKADLMSVTQLTAILVGPGTVFIMQTVLPDAYLGMKTTVFHFFFYMNVLLGGIGIAIPSSGSKSESLESEFSSI